MIINDINFNASVKIQIRFNDIDVFGMVNNSMHQHYFDLGRLEYFASALGKPIDLAKQAIVVAHLEVDYHVPIRISEPITVYTRVARIGNKSFDMHQCIINTDTNEVKSSNKTIMVAFDPINQCAVTVSDEWREAFCQYDKIAKS